ncbi:MAG: hypothetical protein R3357_04300 [Burkholderiales bacterium]|nr:hypothetical protein [Burkholderiales bacterium]
MNARYLVLVAALAASPAAHAAQCADLLKLADSAIATPKASIDEDEVAEARVLHNEASELLAAGKESDCLDKADQLLELLDVQRPS